MGLIKVGHDQLVKPINTDEAPPQSTDQQRDDTQYLVEQEEIQAPHPTSEEDIQTHQNASAEMDHMSA